MGRKPRKKPAARKPARPAPPRRRVAETDVPVAERMRDAHVAGRPVYKPIHIGRPPSPMPDPIDGIPQRLPNQIPRPLPRPVPPAPPAHAIRLQFIATTNTIQFQASLLTPVVTAMNAFFAPGNIEFTYDPQTDFTIEDNALLDRDWDLVDGSSLSNPPSVMPQVDGTRCHGERQRVARQHLGKLVVYVSRGSTLAFQGSGWTIEERGFHYSSIQAEYVVTAATYWRAPWGSIDPQTLAHEIGHYLHQFHTMYTTPATIAEAATVLRDAVDVWGLAETLALRVFDADLPFITDTPPDPGPALFTNVNGSACGGPDAIAVPVTFAGGTSRTYQVAPDRTNLMSYFKGCPQANAFSPQQFARMRVALERGNRNHLLTGHGSWVPRRPAVLPMVGNVGVVALDCTSSPWFAEWTGESFALRPNWRWLGGYVESVAVASDAPGNLRVVARDFSGRYFEKRRAAGAWSPDLSWTLISSRTFDSVPALVSWGTGRFDLFAVATDGSLWWKADSGAGWTAWAQIGSNCLGAPAVACPQANRIDVVTWQQDKSLSHSTFNGTSWSAWQPIAGTVAAPPSLASWGPGRLDLVARGTDNAVYHQWWSGGAWNGSWEYQGGNFTGQPTLIAAAPFRLDIAGRSADGQLWYKTWNGTSWYPGVDQWRQLGAETVDSPALAGQLLVGGRRLDVFARARDGALLHASVDAAGAQLPGPLSFTRDEALTNY